MLRRVASLLLVAGSVGSFSLLLACGGATDPASGERASGLGSSPAPSGTSDPPVPSDPNKPGPDPRPTPPDATLAELQARCQSTTHGPIDTYASYAEFKTKVIGRWFACDHVDGAENGFYAREAGIELSADGKWHYLRKTADGSFETLHGIENEGTWHEKYTGFLGYFQVNTPAGANGMMLTEFAFETAPRRMRTSGQGMTPAWLVPMAAE